MKNGKWKQTVEQLQEQFRRFMVGRYGSDELNRFLLVVFMVLVFAQLFWRSRVCYLLELLCLVLIYYRIFSRNTGRRFKENQAYLNLRFRVTEKLKNQNFRQWKEKAEEARKYKIFKCPNCGQKIRIPRGHGKVSIHCRKCGKDFIGKT